MFTPPRFADRLAWASVPPGVRDQVETGLGARVASAVTRSGGFSPGFAGVLTLDDGRAVFVKAIGAAQNPTTPGLLRSERDLVPDDPAVPRLLFAVDEADDWVALVFDAVAGSSPALPWRRADALLVLGHLRELSARLAGSPCPRTLPSRLAELTSAWDRAEAAGSPVVTGWVSDALPDLAALSRSAPSLLADSSSMGDQTLLHLDLRADNLLVDRAGAVPRVWFVDWPWACSGPAWVDAVLLALDFAAYGGLVPEDVLAEAGIRAPHDTLSALLAALAGQWAAALAKPGQPGMGGIRDFQRRFFDATIGWLRRGS